MALRIVRPACTYCRRDACAYLCRAGHGPARGETGPRWACHQHISTALAQVAWDAQERRPIAVFVAPIGPLADRMHEDYRRRQLEQAAAAAQERNTP